MIRRTIRIFTIVTVPLVLSWSCLPEGSSGGESGKSGDPAEELTNALDFQGQATTTSGPMPEGTAGGPTVSPLPGAGPLPADPGAPIQFQIPWAGGPISGVNIGFGGSKFFKIPVAQGGQSQGMVSITANLKSSVCANLADTCHQIQCYEQVTLPNGTTVSKAAAMQVVLNCTGGTDCNDAGTGDGGSSEAGTCGDPAFPIACGTFCCPSASPVCGTSVCCSTDQQPCAAGCCPSGGTCPPSIPDDCAICCPGDTCCPGDLYCCGDCDTGC